MPCSVSQDEIDYYERAYNQKTYGMKVLNYELVETVACHLAKMIEAGTPMDAAPEYVKIWVREHKKKDAAR